MESQSTPPGSPCGVRPSAAPFPSPGPPGRVPRLPRYYGALRRPAGPPTALRFLRAAVPPRAPVFVPPASPTPAWGLGFSGLATPGQRISGMETTGPPKFLGNPHVPTPCSQTPAGPHAPGHTVRQHGPRVVNREGIPRQVPFGAPSHGLGTRCLRFAAPVTGAPRQTRFRSLARLSRMGLVTHRVPPKGFRKLRALPPPFPSFLAQ